MNTKKKNTLDTDRLADLIAEALDGRLGRRELIRRGLAMGLSLPAVAAALSACGAARSAPAAPPAPSATPPLSAEFVPASPMASPPTAPPAPPTRFAVIGDYGMAGDNEAEVAALVAGWSPDFVVTTGDNNYPSGAADTIDANIGQYYQAFIAPSRGSYGPGAAESRFFPVLGNHDWVVGYPQPYLSYFSLPGNGRYYRVDRGPLSLFMLDSQPDEPDGTAPDSIQGQWLQSELAAATAHWKVVVFHHPPFSSGFHGSSGWMQWPFAAWGAQLVLSGHEHSYERILHEGITYVVNGLGGAARYEPGLNKAKGSQVFYNDHHGAMLVEADAAHLRVQFVAHAGDVVDDVTL